MVSKASDDLPEPEMPVNTMSRSRGYRQVDVAQVVLTRSMDDDLVGHAVNLSARADN